MRNARRHDTCLASPSLASSPYPPQVPNGVTAVPGASPPHAAQNKNLVVLTALPALTAAAAATPAAGGGMDGVTEAVAVAVAVGASVPLPSGCIEEEGVLERDGL